MKYFKVYGLERTGTNYISSLIEKNFKGVKVFMNIGGWKHGDIILYPDEKNMLNTVDRFTKKKYDTKNLQKLFENHQVDFIIMIKNPYAWINSYLKFYKKDKNSENVLEAVKLWNERYENYRKYIDQGKAYLIRYEDVLQDFVKILKNLERKFRLKRSKKWFINIKNKLRPNNDTTLGRVFNETFSDKKIYLNPNPRDFFDEKLIFLINANIDTELVSYYGYEKTSSIMFSKNLDSLMEKIKFIPN